MNAVKLYKQLEKDFITPALSDDWANDMRPISDFLTDNFEKRSMGLVCDNSNRIEKVYSAVFPSKRVMQSVLDRNEQNILLFVHHPMVWDIRADNPFQNMDIVLLRQFKERGISVYNLHVPLDNYGEYSISVSFAKALKIEIEKPFGFYYGGLGGVLGQTGFTTVLDLSHQFTSAIGHRTSLYHYGSDKIKKGRVAIAPGGGNSNNILSEVATEGINTFMTGISVLNDHSRAAHEFAKEKKINILGGTHYSTEKFACIAICDYFKQLGLPCEFIEDIPVMEDL
jgi:putative NIF3 family GTP cyclohydrolase 1 type 2